MSKIPYISLNFSKSVAGYYYNEADEKLFIQFSNMKEYEYSDVKPEEVTHLMNSKSFGSELHKTIISKKQCKKL